MLLRVKKLDPRARVPEYAHTGDAGMDISTLERVVVLAGARAIISTGLAFELPQGTVGLLWDKSGLAAKHGITILSGVLDEGYRGEVKVVVLNTSDAEYTFEAGDKVTQLLIQPIIRAQVEEVSELSDTARGEGRFGSTGK